MFVKHEKKTMLTDTNQHGNYHKTAQKSQLGCLATGTAPVRLPSHQAHYLTSPVEVSTSDFYSDQSQ